MRLFNAEKKTIAEITENSGYIAKSVVDNDDPDFNVSMKRGYGGIAIIWKKEINENIKELIDGENRIQAIHIQQGDKPICLIIQIDVLDTDPQNTSDHVPVILTLNSQLKKVREKATTIIAKPKWTDCDHQICKEIINKDLPNLIQKSKGIIEQDIRNLEKLLHKAGEAAIPKYRRKIKIKPKGKAIWNEQIEKASKQSKSAYKVWRQHGAPQERSNELKIKMTAAKRILRKVQRQAYASQRESTAGKIMKASNADTKLFTSLSTCKEKHHLLTPRY
ncbi:unnamed protein product [Mytilus coruscus]|uniref:Uncharacterized protein n=1 Tax=Mytilus coruscus TaxID=42192 RepID=A0A6J8BR74_MYTCO|nr:unnamed protein product [Mytilus coruscus]